MSGPLHNGFNPNNWSLFAALIIPMLPDFPELEMYLHEALRSC